MVELVDSKRCLLAQFAGRVAELVYAHDSKSCSLRIEGSIPSSPTKPCPANRSAMHFHARIKSGVLYGRASSSPARGTKGN